MMCHAYSFQRRRDSLAECAFRHDHVSQQYDVYYNWPYSAAADDVPGVRRTPSTPRRRRRRRRRRYLGVDRHGTVRTFRVTGVARRRARQNDADDRLEFHLPRRVLFIQRFINGARSSLSSNYHVGRVPIIVPPRSTSPPTTDATGVSPSAADETLVRRKRRKKRHRRTCNPLLSDCRPRRRRRPPNIRRQKWTTT